MAAVIRFSAEGAALPAFRDALRRAHIRCRRQQLRGGVFYAETGAQSWYAVTALAERHAVRLRVLRRRGLRFLLRPYRLRIGLLAGLLAGAWLFYWEQCFVRSIEIYGNSAVSDGEILTALESVGITRGTPMRDIAFTAAERKMRLAVRDIERITLRRAGGRLIVELAEERKAPPLLDDRIPANVTASVGAQVTSISVLGGEAAVARGDAVKAGDLLISGVVTDKLGTTRYYHAAGDVRGIYEADFTAEQPFCTELTVSGETVTEQLLEAFGSRIPLTPGFTPPAGDFVYSEETRPILLFGHPLPFARITCRYTLRTAAIAVWSEEEARGLLRESAERWLQNFHAEDTVLSRKETFSETDLGISLKFHCVFEGVIGKTSEIFVKLS